MLLRRMWAFVENQQTFRLPIFHTRSGIMNSLISKLLQEPEGKRLEFKRDLSSPSPLLKTLVAFANSAGGRLVLGVADDRKVIGFA